MKDWPVEVFVHFLYNIEDLDTLKNICKSSSATWQLCKKYRVPLCKHFLERFRVDYNDPTNFIYVANGVRKENFFDESGEPDYCKLFQLYSKFYDKKKINCEDYKNMTSFPLYPNVEVLYLAQGAEMKSLPDGMKNLRELYCRKNKLESLPNGMIRLEYLRCEFNKLKALPNDMTSVKDLHCGNNVISVFPTGLFSLKELWCGHNELESLPVETLHNLVTLSVDNNHFREITVEMPALEFLSCDNNPIERLPSHLPKMKDGLSCNNTLLTSLPGGMSKIEGIECANCQLTSLPEGMTNLRSLFCQGNQLTSLPADMTKLEELDCSRNQLTTLPLTFKKLDNLKCSGNSFSNEFAQICNRENCATQYKSMMRGDTKIDMKQFLNWARDKIYVDIGFDGELEELESFKPRSREDVKSFLNRIVNSLDHEDDEDDEDDEDEDEGGDDENVFFFTNSDLGDEYDKYQDESMNVDDVIELYRTFASSAPSSAAPSASSSAVPSAPSSATPSASTASAPTPSAPSSAASSAPSKAKTSGLLKFLGNAWRRQ